MISSAIFLDRLPERIKSSCCHFVSRMPDGAQRRMHHTGDWNVVEADERVWRPGGYPYEVAMAISLLIQLADQVQCMYPFPCCGQTVGRIPLWSQTTFAPQFRQWLRRRHSSRRSGARKCDGRERAIHVIIYRQHISAVWFCGHFPPYFCKDFYYGPPIILQSHRGRTSQ